MIRFLADEDFNGEILRVLRRRGESMTGMFVVPQFAPLDAVLESLQLLNEASGTDEWVDRVVFLPFR